MQQCLKMLKNKTNGILSYLYYVQKYINGANVYLFIRLFDFISYPCGRIIIGRKNGVQLVWRIALYNNIAFDYEFTYTARQYECNIIICTRKVLNIDIVYMDGLRYNFVYLSISFQFFLYYCIPPYRKLL